MISCGLCSVDLHLTREFFFWKSTNFCNNLPNRGMNEKEGVAICNQSMLLQLSVIKIGSLLSKLEWDIEMLFEHNCYISIISVLQIGVRGRPRVRVLSSEHAHFENSRPPNLKRMLRTENSYSSSSSYSNLKVATAISHEMERVPGNEVARLPRFKRFLIKQ